MKRLVGSCLILAVGLVFAACGSDTKKKLPDKGVHDGGPDKGIVIPEAGLPDGDGPPVATCESAKIGVRCTKDGGECGEGMTCLLTSDTKGGVCACSCTPDDAQTPLVNEDSCPDLSKNACATVSLTDGSEINLCFSKCDPKLGASACDAPLACNPRSGASVGLFEGAVCMFFGCETGKDCPTITSKTCKTDGSVKCDGTDECIPLEEGGADGLCAKPGKCDVASGICAPRDDNFKATALVGDACKDDTECNKNQKCERETDMATVQKATGAACKEGSECCSGRCTTGKCEAGTCTIHARNGYCYTPSCAFATLTEFACDTGSDCNLLFSGGLCMKTCELGKAETCRGNTADKLGDFECRAWNNISAGGVQVSKGPVCDFGDTIACNTFTSLDCDAFGEQNNPTKMGCRDLKGVALTDPRDPLGFCLDDTASGPAL